VLLAALSGCFCTDSPDSVLARPEAIEEKPAILLSPAWEVGMGDLMLVPAPAEEPVLLDGEPERVVLADRGGACPQGLA
jgi:hypothetical protein